MPSRDLFPLFSALGCLLIGTAPLIDPTPARAQDMPLSQVLIPGENWELVAEGFQFTEGPAADGLGNLFFTDVRASKIYKVDASGKLSTWVEESDKANGLMFGPQGKLYACQGGKQRIVTYDPEGRVTVLTENVPCNDLAVTRAGGVYFTDPPGKKIWFLPPGGERKVVADNLAPNGIILWGDQGTLVVTDSNEPHLWTFRIEKDGSLAHRDRYYGPLRLAPLQTKPGSDGMTVDRDGRLYVTTIAGLQIFDPTGRGCGVLLRPQRASLSNVTFGGPNLEYLYVTCTDKVYRRRTRTAGLLAFEVFPPPKK